MTTYAPRASALARPLTVPRWATVAAHITACLTIPSGLWRIALVVGLPLTKYDTSLVPVRERLYIVSLSLVAEILAVLTLGLVQPWGEVMPRWVPLLGGRRIPPLAAVIPASLGSVALVALSIFATYNLTIREPLGTPIQQGLLIACYVPLLAWGPMLAAVTVAYYRRRRAEVRL
ncbi:hypothetical protein [Actinopolymorpha alba]|uniref:hypothetical protein n=1 Tax=Actinopolymorpha alba TaxID=533267 RepID=UPI00037B28CB|nr:hypothetical protein [Actinopolymorpha alba]